MMDRAVLAEKVAAVERRLARVASRLPDDPASLAPESDASDAVTLHLWLAVQVVIDLAVSACVRLDLGTPATYGDAFRRLSDRSDLEPALAARLAKAAGFRNLVAHAYDEIDMRRVHEAATHGPRDLRAFLGWVRDRTVKG